jgi:hypothetical protein
MASPVRSHAAMRLSTTLTTDKPGRNELVDILF